MERDFKGVWIPKAVWLDDRLSALEKVILTEIDSLDQGERGCYASNKHIAEFCQCSETKVSKAISKLTECGYVYVQKFDGRQRELKSSLAKSARQHSKKYKADSYNVQESNTSNNTITNTNKKGGRFTPPTPAEVAAYCKERGNNINPEQFVDYYTARGWELAKGKKVKDWKACVRTWERNEYAKPKGVGHSPEDYKEWEW